MQRSQSSTRSSAPVRPGSSGASEPLMGDYLRYEISLKPLDECNSDVSCVQVENNFRGTNYFEIFS